jgi:hypothetical protein
LWRPFWKWRLVEIFQCRESIWDIIIYPHIKCWWYRTMLNFCGVVVAILKMVIGRNFQCQDIFIYQHIKYWWYRKMLKMQNWFSNGDLSLCQILCLYHYPFRSYLTMLNFCRIVVAILEMAAGRNFSMSGINSGHHYLPTYQI